MRDLRFRLLGMVLALVSTAAVVCSCGRDARLAGKEIPHVEVREVAHYGMTLGAEAPPELVAAVLLRAIREDVHASDSAARDNARSIQFDLAAANEIAARNTTRLTRDEFVYKVVDRWAPTVSHYVSQFDEDIEKGKKKLVVRPPRPGARGKAGGEEIEVAMQLEDPGGDPNGGAVLLIWMVKDHGFWRVTHLGFDTRSRTLASRGGGGA